MNSVEKWQTIVQEMGVQIGNMSVQLAAANARIKELESERVTPDGDNQTAEQHHNAEQHASAKHA